MPLGIGSLLIRVWGDSVFVRICLLHRDSIHAKGVHGHMDSERRIRYI